MQLASMIRNTMHHAIPTALERKICWAPILVIYSRPAGYPVGSKPKKRKRNPAVISARSKNHAKQIIFRL